MPRITPIELLEPPLQHTLFLRATAPVQELPGLIGESFARIEARLQALGALPSEVPYLLFHSEDPEALDLEIGCAVSRPLPGEGPVQPGTLPHRRVAACFYQGPNEEMASVYQEMSAWIREQGLAATGQVLEQYYNGPDCPPELLLVKVTMPLTTEAPV